MRKAVSKYLILTGAGAALLFSACKKDETGNNASAADKSSITIKLTDSPGNYQQVNVDIKTVSVHLVPNNGSGEWIDLPTKSGIYDLLKLQNGIDTTIVDTVKLAAGKITQMRLLLGSNNTVMEDSVIHPMKVPSGTQSGIKLIGPQTINANQHIQIKIDFDAQQSVQKQGNGDYHLKPTIKTL